MSAGHIQRRGRSSWRLKFEGERDPETGRRKTHHVTFRGTKARAKLKLAELVAAVGGGSYVDPTKLTVGDHVLERIDQWEASEAISARTAQRYRQLANGQIIPHIGSRLVQKLTTLDVETWHATLRPAVAARGVVACRRAPSLSRHPATEARPVRRGCHHGQAGGLQFSARTL